MTDLPPPSPEETPAESLALAGVYPSVRDAADHGLVVLALGHPYWLEPGDSGWRLWVEAGILDEVARQIALFDREAAHWPPRFVTHPEPPGRAGRPVLGPLLWCLSLIGVYQLQVQTPGIERLGLMDAGRVIHDGEVWRAFTALFLHADIAHLTGNLVSGFFVLSAVLAAFGRLRGWLLFFSAAVLANLAVAAASVVESHRSLGASTAVFGGLGLLTGRAVRAAVRAAGPARWKPVLLPLAAGVTLLGLFGAGEPQTDVLAHGAGFLCGAFLGLLSRP